MLNDAIAMSAHNKLVGPKDHVVVVHMVHDAFIVKIVSLDESGRGILQDQPQTLIEMAKVRLQFCSPDIMNPRAFLCQDCERGRKTLDTTTNRRHSLRW